MQILKPLAIENIGFAARNVMHMLSIDQMNFNASSLQDLKQRNPIDTGRFHGDRVHAALLNPVGQGVEALGVRGDLGSRAIEKMRAERLARAREAGMLGTVRTKLAKHGRSQIGWVRGDGGTMRPQLVKGTLVVTVMFAIGYFAFPRTDVWLEPQEQEEAAPLADERVFHLQGQLIERALAAIAPGKSGSRELYFIGFAPDASEEVFLHEMRFVRKTFDERFGTAGHSIALVSSQDALEEFPIASATNLARAIARVGERMNADEDTLFVFLSAHGYRDHRLSAVQPPLELSPLTPTALARMLQDAGVKWRVIVVSACYSGGFIEPLRDDNTIVITASSAERSSFGCEAGRDFTYFGEAYFRDALARTKSFTRAFELARSIVSEREAKEKLEPSLPQMWVGRAIAERLKNAADQPDKE